MHIIRDYRIKKACKDLERMLSEGRPTITMDDGGLSLDAELHDEAACKVISSIAEAMRRGDISGITLVSPDQVRR